MAEKRRRNATSKGNGASPDYALVETPGHLLRRCQQRAVDIFMEEVAPARITPRQFAILATVERRPGLTQTDLVAETGIDRSTVGDMIERLVRRGFVRRHRSGRDQRANTLALSPAGRSLLRSVWPAVERAQIRIIAPLSPALRDSVMEALRLMAGVGSPQTPADPVRRRGHHQ